MTTSNQHSGLVASDESGRERRKKSKNDCEHGGQLAVSVHDVRSCLLLASRLSLCGITQYRAPLFSSTSLSFSLIVVFFSFLLFLRHSFSFFKSIPASQMSPTALDWLSQDRAHAKTSSRANEQKACSQTAHLYQSSLLSCFSASSVSQLSLSSPPSSFFWIPPHYLTVASAVGTGARRTYLVNSLASQGILAFPRLFICLTLFLYFIRYSFTCE